ncbi:MAG: hypothetical protein L3J41_04555 [Melioribacteraceae bacterium]|nr:hypothetical protein [Melioribacteraceae bacterium]
MQDIYSEDSVQVKKVIDQIWLALSEQNVQKMNKFCSTDWHLFSARGSVYSTKQLTDKHIEIMKNFTLVTSQMNIKIMGNTALATYNAQMKGLIKEKNWEGIFL